MRRVLSACLFAVLTCVILFGTIVSNVAFAQDTGGIVAGRVGDNNAIYPDGSITAQIPSSIRLNKLTSGNMSVPYIRPGVAVQSGVYLRSASTNSGDYMNEASAIISTGAVNCTDGGDVFQVKWTGAGTDDMGNSVDVLLHCNFLVVGGACWLFAADPWNNPQFFSYGYNGDDVVSTGDLGRNVTLRYTIQIVYSGTNTPVNGNFVAVFGDLDMVDASFNSPGENVILNDGWASPLHIHAQQAAGNGRNAIIARMNQLGLVPIAATRDLAIHAEPDGVHIDSTCAGNSSDNDPESLALTGFAIGSEGSTATLTWFGYHCHTEFNITYKSPIYGTPSIEKSPQTTFTKAGRTVQLSLTTTLPKSDASARPGSIVVYDDLHPSMDVSTARLVSVKRQRLDAGTWVDGGDVTSGWTVGNSGQRLTFTCNDTNSDTSTVNWGRLTFTFECDMRPTAASSPSGYDYRSGVPTKIYLNELPYAVTAPEGFRQNGKYRLFHNKGVVETDGNSGPNGRHIESNEVDLLLPAEGWVHLTKRADERPVSANVATDIKNNPCYHLEGARYNLLQGGVALSSIPFSDGTSAPYFETAVDGSCKVAEVEEETYAVKEFLASEGYLLDSETHQAVVIADEHTYVTSLEPPIVVDPRPAVKHDADSDSAVPQGDSTVQGAIIGLEYYPGYLTRSQVASSSPRRTWTFATDASGRIEYDAAHLVSGDLYLKNGVPVWILGTYRYYEITPPNGYRITDDDTVMQARSTGVSVV